MRSWPFFLLLLACPAPEDKGGSSDDGGEDTSVDDGDMDLDGDGVSLLDGDCGDRDATVYPGAVELCDGLDNDCNGAIDDGLMMTLWRDLDGDHYGDASLSIEDCEISGGYVDNDQDCDDSDIAIHPDADEDCDGIDNDCDSEIDEDVVGGVVSLYEDSDGDGFGVEEDSIEGCGAFSGYVEESELGFDCDDADAGIYPGADEYCDEVDSDCDGEVDESDSIDSIDWYADSDGDGYGEAVSTATACEAPSGSVELGTDCNDYDESISPDAEELCDEIDNDCDGDTDEDDASDALSWHTDSDGDGYGDPDTATPSCIELSGMIEDGSDCDDGDAEISPDADELCDEVDNDCDGDTDEDVIDGMVYYTDSDGDGYGDPDSALGSCDELSGYTEDASDCDDSDADISPDAEEICSDGIDNNCDGGAGDCAWSGDYMAEDEAEAIFMGEREDELTGFYSQPGVGDHDADGVPDVLFAGMGYSSTTGRTYVIEGPVSGEYDLGSADGRMNGESTGDGSGVRVRWAGDLDADGKDDMFIGAWKDDDEGTDAGAAYVVLGKAFKGGLTSADYKITGVSDGDYAGSGLASLSDMDGDGQIDLAIGAYGEDSAGDGAGAVYLLFGGVSADMSLSDADVVLTGEDESDGAGIWLASGDVDADGLSDLLVGGSGADGDESGSGAAWLLHGPISSDGSLSDADIKLSGLVSGDDTGVCVASGSDVNDDGYDDLLIGGSSAEGDASGSGAAWLFYGPLTVSKSMTEADARLLGESDGDMAGQMVAFAGDVDANGAADVLVGAYKSDHDSGTDAGSAYLLLGPISGDISLTDSDAIFRGGADGAYLGSGLSGVGDLDEDGTDDFIIGAHGVEVDGDAKAGEVYLLMGKGL
jgi:hypothetical protein